MKTIKLRRQWAALFAIGAMLGLALLAAGCGSGGGTNSTPGTPVASTPSGAIITRDTENTVSDDAKILAVRQTEGEFISLDAARAFDADLAALLAAYPTVKDIHARLNFNPKRIGIFVYKTAPFFAKWQAAAASADTTVDDLLTGEPTLDALLKKYDVQRVDGGSEISGANYFILSLAASVNTRVVSKEFTQSSASIARADIFGGAGLGVYTDVTFDAGSGGMRSYFFSQGYGDCLAGCINHYIIILTIAPDGSITSRTEGDPPTGSIYL